MNNYYQQTPKIGFIGACLRYIEDPNRNLITRVLLSLSPLFIVYVISPLDLLPEIILGPLGLADDSVIVVTLFLLIRLAISFYSEKKYVKTRTDANDLYKKKKIIDL